MFLLVQEVSRWRVGELVGAGRTGPVGGSCAGTGEPMPARPAVVTLKPRAALACVRQGSGSRGESRARTSTENAVV